MEDDEIVADILEDDNSDEHEEEGTVEDSHLVTPQVVSNALNRSLQWLKVRAVTQLISSS